MDKYVFYFSALERAKSKKDKSIEAYGRMIPFTGVVTGNEALPADAEVVLTYMTEYGDINQDANFPLMKVGNVFSTVKL